MLCKMKAASKGEISNWTQENAPGQEETQIPCQLRVGVDCSSRSLLTRSAYVLALLYSCISVVSLESLSSCRCRTVVVALPSSVVL